MPRMSFRPDPTKHGPKASIESLPAATSYSGNNKLSPSQRLMTLPGQQQSLLFSNNANTWKVAFTLLESGCESRTEGFTYGHVLSGRSWPRSDRQPHHAVPRPH